MPDVNFDPPPLGDDVFCFEVAWEVVNKGIYAIPWPVAFSTHSRVQKSTSRAQHLHTRLFAFTLLSKIRVLAHALSIYGLSFAFNTHHSQLAEFTR